MGVNGFELLKKSVEEGYPTIMLSARSVTPEALETSMKLGALFCCPRKKCSSSRVFLMKWYWERGSRSGKSFLLDLVPISIEYLAPTRKRNKGFLENLKRSSKKIGLTELLNATHHRRWRRRISRSIVTGQKT